MQKGRYIKKAHGKRSNPYPKRGYKCKWCESNLHYSYTCFDRPRIKVPQESLKARENRLQFKTLWLRTYPPDLNGRWECYLQLSPACLRQVDSQQLNLEHVRPRTRHPKLKYILEAVRPACQRCNRLKATWSVQQLAETYPRIAAMIATPEWQAYEKTLDQLEGKI